MRCAPGFRSLLAALCFSVACACAGERENQSERKLSLPAEGDSNPDVLSFAERERDFLKAVTAGSSDDLASFLHLNFRLYDEAALDTARRDYRPAIPGTQFAQPSFSSDYVRFLKDRLPVVYDERATYKLFRMSAHATVVTYAPDRAPHLTGWDSLPASGWKVTSLLINPAPERIALVENAAKEYAARQGR